MRKVFPAGGVALLALCLASAAAAGSSFRGLNPGGLPDLQERVAVGIVFVGYEPGQVAEEAVLAELADQYEPVVRSRLWYGVEELLGLKYTYDYNVVYADQTYEDAFFGQLNELAEPAPLTDLQEAYNEQESNVLELRNNHHIDAPSVEKWLIRNAPAGVDTNRNTIYFVNWYGRSDFKFHVYTKLGEPDPDTGNDFGLRESRKLIAWGGTAPADEETGYGAVGRGLGDRAGRVWFYDLSAGPESWTDNWNVDDLDLDGDGVEEYRMPPIWEYSAGGYRSPSALASDLGKVTRYVALDLLMTSSPLYPPYLTPLRLPRTINLDLNTYEGWPGVDASATYQKPGYLLDEESELLRVPATVDTQDVPFTGEARGCYVLWLLEEPCYPTLPSPGFENWFFANLFLYAALNRPAFLDGGGEYEALAFNYATTDEEAPGFLGYADDNWIDGTQSFIFNFVSPGVVEAGYGLTTTQIHEYGHHFGLSHPHDGYDSESKVDFEPSGPFYFAWSGDEHNSMMSYIDLNWDFSQFDFDNSFRHRAAGYMVNANAIAALILESPNRSRASFDLLRADVACELARSSLAAHRYEQTFELAKQCYDAVVAGAEHAGVPVEIRSPNGWTVLPEVTESGVERKAARSYSFDRDLTANERRFRP